MTDELPADVRAYVDALVLDVRAEDPGPDYTLDPSSFQVISLDFASTAALEESWERGKLAARIRWGTDGSMERCIAQARKVGMRDPGGYCATRHKGATGQWPTTGGKAGIPS
jgi:hypothetical protein